MRSIRFAAVLWLIFALVVWNVVFDRIVVVAGREFVYAAAASAATSSSYVLAEPWMRAAQQRALWQATVAALLVAAVGATGIAVAVRRERSRRDVCCKTTIGNLQVTNRRS